MLFELASTVNKNGVKFKDTTYVSEIFKTNSTGSNVDHWQEKEKQTALFIFQPTLQLLNAVFTA